MSETDPGTQQNELEPINGESIEAQKAALLAKFQLREYYELCESLGTANDQSDAVNDSYSDTGQVK